MSPPGRSFSPWTKRTRSPSTALAPDHVLANGLEVTTCSGTSLTNDAKGSTSLVGQ